MKDPRGHQQIEHTADLALELWAPTQEELLEEGARAIVEILTEGQPIEPNATRSLRIEALDPEDRLVQWLNRVLLLAILDGFLVKSATICLEGEQGLSASLEGETEGSVKMLTELKSVTYHGLLLERQDEQWRARIVIDV